MTKIINLFGGPGSGKSTTAAGLFHLLKTKNVNVELVTEFAKDAVYEDATTLLWNQLHVFSEQFRRQYRLLNKVDYVITDSPILLSSIYYELYLLNNKVQFSKQYNKLSVEFFDKTFNEFDNLNYLIKRSVAYNPLGRIQDENQCNTVDMLISNKLKNNQIYFKEVTINDAVSQILDDLNTKYLTN